MKMECECDEVVLITGCSSGGIGHALALEFASRGCHVVASSRSRGSMPDLARDPRFQVEELDVTSEQSVNDAVSSVVERYGRVDILVNNAGAQCVAPLAEVPLSALQNTFNTNTFGPIRMVQAVVPQMALQRKGKIVNIGSISVMCPGPWSGVYTASKAAVHAFSDTLRLELRPLGINVINVAPGAIDTNMPKSNMVTYNKMPEWKLFKAYEEAIRGRALLLESSKVTPVEEFAKKTVDVVLQKNPPASFCYGHFSTAASIMYHLPPPIKDFFMIKGMPSWFASK